MDGYELDDLAQEVYLALLTDDSEDDWPTIANRRLRTLKRRSLRRQPMRVHQIPPDPGEKDRYALFEDDAKSRSEGSLDALVLMIAAEQECRNERDRELLALMVQGLGYWGITRELNISHGKARKRVSLLRRHLREKIPEENE
jgi:DNA-directed RNA polymerase specialized sigma24 family protein